MMDADILDEVMARLFSIREQLGPAPFDEAARQCLIVIGRVALAEAEARARGRGGNVVAFPKRILEPKPNALPDDKDGPRRPTR
jgi:hypothetical protein